MVTCLRWIEKEIVISEAEICSDEILNRRRSLQRWKITWIRYYFRSYLLPLPPTSFLLLPLSEIEWVSKRLQNDEVVRIVMIRFRFLVMKCEWKYEFWVMKCEWKREFVMNPRESEFRSWNVVLRGWRIESVCIWWMNRVRWWELYSPWWWNDDGDYIDSWLVL